MPTCRDFLSGGQLFLQPTVAQPPPQFIQPFQQQQFQQQNPFAPLQKPLVPFTSQELAPGFIPLDNTILITGSPTPPSQPPSPPPPPPRSNATPVAAADPVAPAVPSLQPAQFALSSNIVQHSASHSSSHHQSQQPLNVAVTPTLATANNGGGVSLDCAAGNDLGFCSVSDRYPRYSSNLLGLALNCSARLLETFKFTDLNIAHSAASAAK